MVASAPRFPSRRSLMTSSNRSIGKRLEIKRGPCEGAHVNQDYGARSPVSTVPRLERLDEAGWGGLLVAGLLRNDSEQCDRGAVDNRLARLPDPVGGPI